MELSRDAGAGRARFTFRIAHVSLPKWLYMPLKPHPQVWKAIKQRRIMRLVHHDKQRIIEPHDHGILNGSVQLLAGRAYLGSAQLNRAEEAFRKVVRSAHWRPTFT